MHTTISPICISCQSTIGHFYPIYYRILLKRVQDDIEKHGYSFEDFAANADVGMGDVLDKLGVKNLCCRQLLMAHNRVIKGSI